MNPKPAPRKERASFKLTKCQTLCVASYQATVSASNLSYLFPKGICDVP